VKRALPLNVPKEVVVSGKTTELAGRNLDLHLVKHLSKDLGRHFFLLGDFQGLFAGNLVVLNNAVDSLYDLFFVHGSSTSFSDFHIFFSMAGKKGFELLSNGPFHKVYSTSKRKTVGIVSMLRAACGAIMFCNELGFTIIGHWNVSPQ
jgi:hypothetical protein